MADEPTQSNPPDPLGPPGLDGIERLFGVIGWPVAHSMSPAIHNAAFAELGLPFTYRLFPVPPDLSDLEAFLSRCRESSVPVGGCSVTIPHKVNAITFLERVGGRIEPLAKQIGAVNTLAFTDGGVYGANTDYAAAVGAIASALPGGREELTGKKALLVGAGGAGRAIAFGLTAAGCELTIADLDAARAEALAAETKAAAVPLADIERVEADVIANATPVGMYPNVERTPLPTSMLRAGQVVFDAVYNPLRTQLLTEADAAGCRTVPGVEMFVGQAVAQFELWTGKTAPREVMRNVVLERLR